MSVRPSIERCFAAQRSCSTCLRTAGGRFASAVENRTRTGPVFVVVGPGVAVLPLLPPAEAARATKITTAAGTTLIPGECTTPSPVSVTKLLQPLAEVADSDRVAVLDRAGTGVACPVGL